MAILKKQDFEKLAKFKNGIAISIFMPTHKAGKDVLEEKDRIQLKSQWKKVYEQLKDLGTSKDIIDSLGKPVEELLSDTEFWRHQNEGLALFIAPDFFKKIILPIDFEPFVYISDHFYLKALVPELSGNAEFYLLALQMDRVEFFKANRYQFKKVELKGLVPSRLEERVGFDYEERKQQRQVVGQGQGKTIVQGDNAAARDRKNEFLRFFQAVDKGLHEELKNKKNPLIVACQDYLFPIYKEANTYQYLYPKDLQGNPADYNRQELHTAAVAELEPFFNNEKEDKMVQFKELNPNRTSTVVSEIIPAIYEGKVDTLFLRKNEEVWGNYDPTEAIVEIDKEHHQENISLTNMAAVKVIEQNGKVYLMDAEFMPNGNAKMNAIYRY